MKNIIKRLGVSLLALCLLVPMLPTVVLAADGKIQLTDVPDSSVGAYVYISCAIKSDASTIGDCEVKLNYDPEYMTFKTGDDVEKTEDGSLTLTGSGGSTEQRWNMKFQAIKEGSTTVTIEGEDVKSSDGTTLSMTEGSGAIQIAAGDESLIEDGEESTGASDEEDEEVEVNGTSYTLTSDVRDSAPEGYEKTSVSYNGNDRTMYKNETNGLTLAYLKDENGRGAFFIYDEDKETFYPYTEITISDSVSIVILSNTDDAGAAPDEYVATTMQIGDQEYPVWQNVDADSYYAVYAVNNKGEKEFYRYDADENTYQRLEANQTVTTTDSDGNVTTKKQVSILDSLGDLISRYIQVFVILSLVLIVIVVISLLSLSTKLRHRNRELDEIYEEYGMDGSSKKKVKAEERQPKKKKRKKAKPAQKPRKNIKQKAKKEIPEEEPEEYELDDDSEEFEEEPVVYDEEPIVYDEEPIVYDEEPAEDDFETVSVDLNDEYDDHLNDHLNDDFAEFEEDFSTGEIAAKDKRFSTSEVLLKEEEFTSSEFDFDDDLLDGIESDEEVVYGGHNSTGELTIDDLDELLGEKPGKNKKFDDDNETFKIDFVDLD